MCRWLAPSSLADLTKKENRDKVVGSERIMTEARKLCDVVDVNKQVRVRILGRLDVRLITHIMKKGKDFEGKTYASPSDIAEVHACARLLVHT